MQITSVDIRHCKEKLLRAFVTITFENCFVVRHIRIVQTEKGLIVSMPSMKLLDGTHKDICHPINKEFRSELERVILAAYSTSKPMSKAV